MTCYKVKCQVLLHPIVNNITLISLTNQFLICVVTFLPCRWLALISKDMKQPIQISPPLVSGAEMVNMFRSQVSWECSALWQSNRGWAHLAGLRSALASGDVPTTNTIELGFWQLEIKSECSLWPLSWLSWPIYPILFLPIPLSHPIVSQVNLGLLCSDSGLRFVHS